MSKHTPGPWFVNWAGSGKNGQFVYDECYVYAPSSGVEDVAVAADIADPLTGKPSEANARLISAAPELLAELEKMVKAFLVYAPKTDGAEYNCVNTARAAIAKAEGTS